MDIKELRLKMKLTQQELAFKLGVAVTTIARWESGVSRPRKMALILIEEIFGIDIDSCRKEIEK